MSEQAPTTINPRRRQRRPFEDRVYANEAATRDLDARAAGVEAQVRLQRELLDGHADLLARLLAQLALVRADLASAAAAHGSHSTDALREARSLRVLLDTVRADSAKADASARRRGRARFWAAVVAFVALFLATVLA